MANLKEIRTRISSVKSTQQITSAMKMVSAAKLRKSQSAITKLRPYSQKMSEIMSKLGTAMTDDIPFARNTDGKETNVLIIALTSNKGLCSAFNSSVIKLTNKTIDVYQKQGCNVDLMSYGKKGDSAFKRMSGINYLGTNDDIWETLTFDNVTKETDKFMNAFLEKKYDRIEIVYNQFKNAATQIPTVETFLPISNTDKTNNKSTESKDNSGVASNERQKSNTNSDYIFSPSKEEIINTVIPQSLKTQMYKCFIDSFTSEHGARMSSMNKATDNAQSLLKDLTLTYNKQRQSDITNQIIEVSNGANAV